MANQYTIYIPSKGRSTNCMTANNCLAAGLKCFIVVEPQDYKKYLEHYTPDLLIKLPKNDQGMWYVRQYILEYSRKSGEKAHWQMDDDIRKFMRRIDDKNVKVDPVDSVLRVERIFKGHTNLAMIAHRYTSFAFSYKTDFSYNQNPCSSILLRNDVKAKWRKGTVEDADFALQVLNSGWSTIVTNRELIDTVPHMKQAGGLTDAAKAGYGRQVRFQKLVEDWPGCFSISVDDSGNAKLRHKRIWSSFPQRPTKRVKSK